MQQMDQPNGNNFHRDPLQSQHIDPSKPDGHQRDQSGFIGEPEKAKILLNDREKDSPATDRDM